MAVDHLGVLHQINQLDVHILINDMDRRGTVSARSLVAALRVVESLMDAPYDPERTERLLHEVIKQVRASGEIVATYETCDDDHCASCTCDCAG